MKIKNFIYLLFAASILMFAGCTYDNYTAPSSVLSGNVGYAATTGSAVVPVGVRSNTCQLELWQHGFALFSKISVYIQQDGSYHAILADGNYLLTYLKGVGPWVTKTDTIPVTVKGNTVQDFPVEPYFFIKSSSFVKTGTNIVATLSLQQVNTTIALSQVYLYLNNGTILDLSYNKASATVLAAAITDKTAPITITCAIPASLATADYLYARVAVKTTGVTEMAYGLPQQVLLK
jgi:hypothetical protein